MFDNELTDEEMMRESVEEEENLTEEELMDREYEQMEQDEYHALWREFVRYNR